MKCGEHVFFSFQICVEGNIASGKTSFLKYFDGTPDIEVRNYKIVYKCSKHIEQLIGSTNYCFLCK